MGSEGPCAERASMGAWVTDSALVRFVLTALALVLPLAITSMGRVTIIKEMLLVVGGCASVSVLEGRRLAAWLFLTSLMAFSAWTTPEIEVSHARVLILSSLLAVGLAASGRLLLSDYLSVLRASALAAFLVAIDATFQAFGHAPIMGAIVGLIGGNVNEMAFLLPESSDVGRAYGLIGNPNHLGAYFAVVIPLMWAAVRLDSRFRALYFVAGAVGLIALLLSYSRGAYLALGVASIFYLAHLAVEGRLSRMKGILIAVIILASALVVFPRMETLASPESRQVTDRLAIWGGATAAFLARPIFGWGLGGFGVGFSRHVPADWWNHVPLAQPTNDAHNEILDLLVEAGAVGVLPIILIAALLWRSTVVRLRSGDERLPGLAAALLAGLVAGQFTSVLKQVAVALPLLLAALLVFARSEVQTGKMRAVPARRFAAAALLLLATAPYFAANAYFARSRYVGRADPALAAVYCLAARAIRPRDPSIWYVDSRSNLPRSLEDLEALANAYPGYRDVEFSIAEFATKRGDFAGASAWAGRAYLLKPTAARLASWTKAVANSGDLAEARRLAMKLKAEIEPGDPEGFRYLGSILLAGNEFSSAIDEFLTAGLISGSDDDALMAAIGYAKLAQYDTALSIVAAAATRDVAETHLSAGESAFSVSMGAMENSIPREWYLNLSRWDATRRGDRNAEMLLLGPRMTERDLPWLYHLADRERRRDAPDGALLDRILRIVDEGALRGSTLAKLVVRRARGFEVPKAASPTSQSALNSRVMPYSLDLLNGVRVIAWAVDSGAISGVPGGVAVWSDVAQRAEAPRLLLAVEDWIPGERWIHVALTGSDGVTRVESLPIGRDLVPGSTVRVPLPGDVVRAQLFRGLPNAPALKSAFEKAATEASSLGKLTYVVYKIRRPWVELEKAIASDASLSEYRNISPAMLRSIRSSPLDSPVEQAIAALFLEGVYPIGVDTWRLIMNQSPEGERIVGGWSRDAFEAIGGYWRGLGRRLRGLQHRTAGDHSGALELAKGALALNQFDDQARLLMARSLRDLGRETDAVREYGRLRWARSGIIRDQAIEDIKAAGPSLDAASLPSEIVDAFQRPPVDPTVPIRYRPGVILESVEGGLVGPLALNFLIPLGATMPVRVQAVSFQPINLPGGDVTMKRRAESGDYRRTVRVDVRGHDSVWIYLSDASDSDAEIEPLDYPADPWSGVFLFRDRDTKRWRVGRAEDARAWADEEGGG